MLIFFRGGAVRRVLGALAGGFLASFFNGLLKVFTGSSLISWGVLCSALRGDASIVHSVSMPAQLTAFALEPEQPSHG